MNLADQLVAIHASLTEGGVEHAFGGAIALAYWVEDPRGTNDIDVNVFVAPQDCERILAALPDGVAYDDDDVATIKRDGQTRLWWDGTPIDLFFSNLPIHHEAARHSSEVPFEGVQVPILGPAELALFKAIFDRTQDWADIEAMLLAQTLDAVALRARLVEFLGEEDQRLARLDESISRASRAESR
jgi:hypothetical protein